jgi:N-acetylneuraminic acid mutarotase
LAAALPEARTEGGGTVCRGRLFVVGGITAWAQTLTSVWSYDPIGQGWLREPDVPVPVNHGGVVCVADTVYVVGGFGPLGLRPRGFMLARWAPLNTVYALRPGSTSWASVAALPEARGAGGVTATADSLWYAGGIAPNLDVSADLFRFDVRTEVWSREPAMPTPRDHLRLEATHDALFAISGRRDDLRFNLATTERFDLATRQWHRVADVTLARGGLASVVLDDHIYSFGGEFPWTCADVVERYDPVADRWVRVGTLPEARHGIIAGVLAGRIHLVSGGRHPRVSVSGIHRVLDVAPVSAGTR